MQTITAAELKKLLDSDKGVILVDVRTPGRYSEKHIPGAINAPATDDFAKGLAKAAGGMDAALVLYAEHEADDAELKATCEQAEALGYKDVSCLKGGIMAWMEAGGTVEGGQES
ncbi:hypothetical protein A2856_04130 [Candidatus Uhrbacteria bacterium RIFCSPHIGHO2_01_FULL_63_20]|uniref:Rhodanese domain-containing protein n=1 Tax=Candidatus Uhrbacteria bacterium RIFCSPHIGHO2_01_FULL_63_20 TaxID=1802385 RepID=A0A1F7TNX7_9BACT|nr:MAG: hypothetical protein A2856_04130 [Candidatus Uhrbacteria bacterium RIFCSPHIGHO2_01_FULL_63_20]